MAEYIEREELLEELCAENCGCVYPGKACENCRTAALVESIPASDVAPVVHGRWVHDGCRFKGGVDWCHCSECGGQNNFAARTNYCPHCGAKMDGGGADD